MLLCHGFSGNSGQDLDYDNDEKMGVGKKAVQRQRESVHIC